MSAEVGNVTESPAYSIQLFSERDAYNKGDEVSISIYINGKGSIDESEILGHVAENIISGKVNLTVFRFAQSTIGEWEGYKPVLPPQKFELPNRFYGILSEGYFTPRGDKQLLWSEGHIIDPEDNKSYPPISVSFVINKDAPSGDHKVELIFKYKSSDGDWFITKETLTIHIRSLVEINAIGLTILFSAIITGCISAIFWLLSHFG